MSDTAIDNLQQAIKTAAGAGEFALDSAFLTKGLNDPGVTVPATYDNDLKAAFQLTSAAGFLVTASPEKVGTVTNGGFTVTDAVIPFLSSSGVLKSSATLVFSVTDDAQPTLVVQIASAPINWTWTNSFEFMGGWPFNQLVPSNALFVFATADGMWPWGDSAGQKVKGGAKQNFSAGLPLPRVVEPFLVLFSELPNPAELNLTGVLDMSAYNGTTVLLPTGTLTAVLQNGQFSVLYLTVSNPSITVEIPAAPADSAADDSGQSPTLAVSALLGVGDAPPDNSPYVLQVEVTPPAGNGPVEYSIGLNVTGAGSPLTPDSIVALIGGGASYFSEVPPVLQQFLAFVSLQGLSLAGTFNPTALTQAGVQIGSSPDTSWSPIPYPPPGLNFSITEFSLQWWMSVSDSLTAARKQNFLFVTQFTLLPLIFKGAGGEGDGVFTVEFTSDLKFSAGFAGTVGLRDFLWTLSDGAVSLPSTIQTTLSEIDLTVDFSAKSFSFSSAFEVSLSFLTVDTEPILSISNGNVSISALTPPQGDPKSPGVLVAPGASTGTVWQGSVGGLLGVGPLQANVVVAYDATVEVPVWNLSASLAQPITVQELIKQFFSAGEVYNFPAFLPGTLTISMFAITAVIPSGSATTVKTSYTVDVDFLWCFSLGEQQIISLASRIGLKYDGAAFSGSVLTTWTYDAINLELILQYTFQADNQTLSLTWQGFTALYMDKDNTVTFSLKGWSLGSLVQALVRTLGDPYYTLPSPWDLLDQVSLDGLRVIVSLQSGLKFTQRLSASYELSSPLNLGFIVITALTFRRDTTGKVTLEIVGSSPISNSLGNLMKPGGQDVQNMPPVPGRGNDYFKVFLLVLGQRIGITDNPSLATTADVIKALEKVPSTAGKTNPVNPDPEGQFQPYYEKSNNWLIAAHLGLLKMVEVWTVDAMVVFNDPNVYGLRLALAGSKAGGLANLAIDILYKKITDDIGMFQVNFTFPDAIRNINTGSVSIVLPQIGIQIYTNGDFLIDIGFPYNLDFRRSFSLYAIVYGVPVAGSGGFYFGKLSSATATQVPQTNAGTFDPVIVLGIGLQLGLGYEFTKGPLSAGFSLTVLGIVEGVIAAWHPYSGSTTRSVTALGDSLQSEYFFKISGTVGVIGLLYGKIDFSIIQGSINVKIVLSLQITYESYRAIPLTATASVSVSLSVKINLGLFSISISFSFSTTVSAQFVIGENEPAPWDRPAVTARTQTSRLHASVLYAGPEAVRMRAARVKVRLKRVVRAAGTTPELKILAAPQFTVLAPEGATAYSQQQGAFVFLTAIDAPTATGTPPSNTSFDLLCAGFFPWVIDALGNSAGDTVDLDAASATVVTRDELDAYVKKLSDTANPPLNIAGLLGFLASAFVLNIETPDYANSSGDEALFKEGASVFPAFDGLSLTVPDPTGGPGTKPIAFETYAKSDSAYRKTVADLFAEVEATIEKQNQHKEARFRNAADDAESMAALIFVDYFAMMGRQLLQAARNLLDAYAWPLQTTDSIASILAVVNASGNQLQIPDVAVPNQDHALQAGLTITITPASYTIQTGDTLASIATHLSDPASPAQWTVTPAELILANPSRKILEAGVVIPVGNGYRTVPGDKFQSVADALHMSLAELSQQTAIYPITGLLIPALPMALPPVAALTYVVQSSVSAQETLFSIAARFSDDAASPRWTTTPAQLILANPDARILQPGVEIKIGDGYPTVPGDSFRSVADGLHISLEQLSLEKAIYGQEGLLTPALPMTIPPIAYKTGDADTLGSVAAQFGTTVPVLAMANCTVQGLFSIKAEGGILTLANLTAWNVAQLWTAIQGTGQVAQTAGMISRFLMFGLRLPSATGLTLSEQFLYPRTQSGYALYQLTGQEFPTAPKAEQFKIEVSAAESSHGVSLSFVQFDGKPGSSASIDLTTAYGGLSTVLAWAQQGNFQPSPGFKALPSSLAQPKGFAASNFSYWVTSDMAGLQKLTNRGGSAAAGSGQAQPTLWPLPSSLMALTEARQAALTPLFTGMGKVLPLLPQFQPQRGQTSPASQQTSYSNLTNWAWTTRVDFQIKRLPVSGLESGGADDTPNGPATAPNLPNIYEVTGASSAGTQSLELLLRSMDSLGEGIVSRLFLLYEQPGQTPSLATLGETEFLAFLTQTNLSTETNPERSMTLARAAAGAPPRGVANSPGEFIKLLWELSTVRSGGYYLFYQVINGGAGLPSNVFDAGGSATLSMVATFAISAFGETTPAFVNSFVTTDSLDTATDVVQLLSQPTLAPSAPVNGRATIASVASLYGARPGAIAAQNAGSPALAANTVIPMRGIVRQLTQADVVNPSQTLANLAAYYSKGAQNTISAADIQNYNHGVQVALGAVFAIPTIYYVVSGTSAPGNTFASMAAYYGQTTDAISINALNVPGIFFPNTVLRIDTQLFDLRSLLGPGNVSFELTRANYGLPPDQPTDPAVYAQKYMYSLYNTLSAGVLSNAYFEPDSPLGLPFGPQAQNDPVLQNGTSGAHAFSSHAQVAERRRAMLSSQAEADFEYSQSLGFGAFAKVNAAPPDQPAGLPDNPYVGVGTTCQVALRWQDVFGNTTITPFSQPPASYTGTLSGAAVNIRYSDRLVGVSGWTNTMANYIYSGTAGSPVLSLSFRLFTKPYEGDKEQAKRDLALYQTVYFQLHQDYSDLGVPGVTGNAVTMSLRNSILGMPDTELSAAQAGQIRGYVEACVKYLTEVVGSAAAVLAPIPKADVDIPVDVTGVAAGNILPLDVTLVLTRNAVLTDPAVAALADGLSVSGAILPRPDLGAAPGQRPPFVGFAKDMEMAFQTADWYIKVGEGLKMGSDPELDNTALQLWAVRFGTSSGKGIFFRVVEDAPNYYAPKPVATTLVSRTAQITDYGTGKPVTLSFTGVDQNEWFQTCLDAIDGFLSATDSTSAFILDKLQATDDPLKKGNLGKVLQTKQNLADSIAGTVKPILSTSLSDSSTQFAAQEKFRQQLLNQIGSAYAAGAAVVYNVTGVSGAPPLTPAGPPNLYGQPRGVIPGSGSAGADPTGNQNYTLTTARIPLGPTINGANTYDPRLSFFFTTRIVETQAYVPLKLTLAITHLEFNRNSVPGIDGYVQSEWLVFVNGPFEYDLSTSTVANIPVVNRNLPTPPTVQKQVAAQPDATPLVPAELVPWNYSFDYLYRFVAQDTVQTRIKLNLLPSGGALEAFAAGPDLFTALAQFVTSYPAISEDFKTYLSKIDAKTTDQNIINGAAKAVGAFQQYLTAVATAYAETLKPVAAAFTGPPNLITVDFETALSTDPGTGGARTDLLHLRINGVDAVWNQAARTISARGVTLPVPVVAIDPANYLPVVPQDAGASPAYVYQRTGSKPPEYLPYSSALANPVRTVAIPRLDVLLHQNCLSTVSVDRNKILFPVGSPGVSTNPAFVFTTPEVSFADPVVPRVVHPSFSLDQPGMPGRDLETLLNAFFASLFTAGDGSVAVEAAMAGSYSYDMQTGFRVSLPVFLLPPAETAVDTGAPPTFTRVVAGAVSDWIAQQHPTTSGNAQTNFRLTMFGSGDKQPLLVVENLYHAI